GMSPGVEQMPLVRALVRGVERRLRRPEPLDGARVVEAGHLRVRGLAVDRERVLAGRDLQAARIAAEVDVYLLAARRRRVEPDEGEEMGAVGRGVVGRALAADLACERVRYPRRAVHRRVDPVREALPADAPRGRTAPRGGLRRGCGRVARPTAAAATGR